MNCTGLLDAEYLIFLVITSKHLFMNCYFTIRAVKSLVLLDSLHSH